MNLNIQLRDNDSYMDIDVKDGKNSTINGTEVSTFTTETLPLADEKRLNILSKKKDSVPPKLLAYFKPTGPPSQGLATLNHSIISHHGRSILKRSIMLLLSATLNRSLTRNNMFLLNSHRTTFTVYKVLTLFTIIIMFEGNSFYFKVSSISEEEINKIHKGSSYK